MAQNTTPIFLLTPRVAQATTGTNANTALDGTGTVTSVFVAGANGSKIEDVFLNHMGTNVATVVRFFIDPTGSSSYKLIHEETMAANTLSQSVSSIPVYWKANLIIPASGKLGVTIGTAIAAGIMVQAVGGDY